MMTGSTNCTFSMADYDAVRAFDLFATFTHEELRRILRGASCRSHPRGTVLFVQGDTADRFFLILSGRVKLVKTSTLGDEVIVELFGDGQSFGEAAMFTSRRFPVGAELLAESRLVQIGAGAFLSELEHTPDLAFKMLANLARLHRRLVRQLGELRLQSPVQRLGSYLLTLTGKTEGQAVVRLPEDKAVIASQIGIASESLSRAFGRLRETGVHCQGREVVVDDIDRLRAFCTADEGAARPVRACGMAGPCAALGYRAGHNG